MANDLFKLFERSGVGSTSTRLENLESISPVEPEQDEALRRASLISNIDLKVDYSDFKNFVKFNSAYEYFSITAERMLNEYPNDGTTDDVLRFKRESDGYQRFVLSQWPSQIGHLRFKPVVSSSYVKFDDIGVVNGVTRTSLMSPGTGSFSIQCWCDVEPLTGSDDVSFIYQKSDKRLTHPPGLFLYLSGSQVFFTVASGSITTTVSASISQGTNFISAVCDRSSATGSVYMITGSFSQFPVIVQSTFLGFSGRLDLQSGSFSIGSGMLGEGKPNFMLGKTDRPLSGSLDDVSCWSVPRLLPQLTSSYNRKLYAQPGLVAGWRFNESQQVATDNPRAAVITDCSGHRLDGRVQGFFQSIRGSGSLAYDAPDPIITLDDPEVTAYILEQQTSGSAYDRTSNSKILDLFPSAFSNEDDEEGNRLFKNFSYALGRQFDQIKLYIDQFSNFMRVDHGDFDQAPDALLADVGQFFGWEQGASFVDADATKYLLGLSVSSGSAANQSLSDHLFDLKTAFWKRTLLTLPYLYKTKGTRESVESLLRVYGLSKNHVRLKEYSSDHRSALIAKRINSEKSTFSLMLSTGSLSGSVVVGLPSTPVTASTIEIRMRVPTTSSVLMDVTLSTGSIWSIFGADGRADLRWERDVGSTTGSLVLTLPETEMVVSQLPIFDDKWFNISVVKEMSTGSFQISARSIEDGKIFFSSSSLFLSSSISGFPSASLLSSVSVGTSGSLNSQQWTDEFKFWTRALSPSELDDHCLNYQSYGRDVSFDNEQLLIHWRLNEGQTVDSNGIMYHEDVSGHMNVGTGSFSPSTVPYTKFLQGYSYIASPDGWTEEKTIAYNSNTVPRGSERHSSRFISLEMNLVDALNEDISQIMTSFEEMNNILGFPVNKHREQYEGLHQARETYFKRLQGELNFRVFIDMLDFFDRSFVDLVKRLLPARAIFVGDEIVIESHMLERPKFQYNIRPVRDDLIIVEGRMKMFDRDDDSGALSGS